MEDHAHTIPPRWKKLLFYAAVLVGLPVTGWMMGEGRGARGEGRGAHSERSNGRLRNRFSPLSMLDHPAVPELP